MCIGYFIDNELRFNDIMKRSSAPSPTSLQSRRSSPTSRRNTERSKKLNKAWGTDFADWEKLAENPEQCRKGRGYRADSDAFYAKFVRPLLPDLPGGDQEDRAAPALSRLPFRRLPPVESRAGRRREILRRGSVNTYQNSVANVDPKSFGEKPILIGEFHFGTYDRGSSATGSARRRIRPNGRPRSCGTCRELWFIRTWSGFTGSSSGTSR